MRLRPPAAFSLLVLLLGLGLGPAGAAAASTQGSLPKVQRNIEYTRIGAKAQRLDAWIPGGSGPFPAAVLVHGGAWVMPGRTASLKPLLGPLEDAGFAWFAISYRTAHGKQTVEDGIDDVASAVRFVEDHAAEYRVDPGRIVLIGESSGGHLAAMAVVRGQARVRALVAFSSPMDLASQFWMVKAIPPPFRWLKTAQLTALSPIAYVHPGLPPILLIHGTADLLVPVSQSERMCERLRAVGARCELYLEKAAPHNLNLWIGRNGYKRYLFEWLRRQLGAGRG